MRGMMIGNEMSSKPKLKAKDAKKGKDDAVAPVFIKSVSSQAALPSSNGLKTEVAYPAESVIALEMMAEGKTYDVIHQKTGLGFGKLKMLRSRHGIALDLRRQQLAEDGFEEIEGLRLLVGKKMEQLADDPEQLKKVNLRDLIQSQSLMMERSFEALGEAKVVVEHRSGRPSLEDAKKAIEEARASLQKEATPVEAVVVEVQVGSPACARN